MECFDSLKDAESSWNQNVEDVPTRDNNTLDLFFYWSSILGGIIRILPGISDHKTVSVSSSTQSYLHSEKDVPVGLVQF